MRKLSLSSHGLSLLEGQKGFDMFTFSVCGASYTIPNFIAFFISPKLSNFHSINTTISSISLSTQDYTGIFKKVIDLAFGKEVQIFENELQTVHDFAVELENAELCTLLNDFIPIKISIPQKKTNFPSVKFPIHQPLNSMQKPSLPSIRNSGRTGLNPKGSSILPPLNLNSARISTKPLKQQCIKANPPSTERSVVAPRRSISPNSNKIISTQNVTETKFAESWKFEANKQPQIFVLNTKMPRRGAVKICKAIITSSSIRCDGYEAANIVDSNIDKCFVSKNESGSWIEVDFNDKFIVPCSYSISGISSVNGYQPQNWALEVKHNKEWFTVDRQKNTPLSQGECRVIQLERKFASSCFRIRQLGENTSGTQFFALSTFELFGTVYVGRME